MWPCKSSVTSLTTTLAPSSIPFSPKGNTWGLPSCCIPLFHPRSLKDPLKTLTSFPQHPALLAARWAPSFCFLGGQTEIKILDLPGILSVERAMSFLFQLLIFTRFRKNKATFQLLSDVVYSKESDRKWMGSHCVNFGSLGTGLNTGQNHRLASRY